MNEQEATQEPKAETEQEITERTPQLQLIAKLHEAKTNEDCEQIIKETLGIGFGECKQALSQFLTERGGELMDDMINLAPYGDYGKMTEEPTEMLKFLQEEASKDENWLLCYVSAAEKNGELIELIFDNKAVDDGDILKGYVFVGLSGKIRHAFVQVA